MGVYAKTAPGERLTYRPHDLSQYEGEPFCLRITPGTSTWSVASSSTSTRRSRTIPSAGCSRRTSSPPSPTQVDEMESWMEPWLRIDPMLPKKYALLRQMIAKVQAQFGDGAVLHQPRARPHQYRGHRPQSSRDQRVRRRQLRRQDPGPRPRVPRRRGAPARAGSVGAVPPGPRPRRHRADRARQAETLPLPNGHGPDRHPHPALAAVQLPRTTMASAGAASGEGCSEPPGRFDFALVDPVRDATLKIAVPPEAGRVLTLGDVLSSYRSADLERPPRQTVILAGSRAETVRRRPVPADG